MVKTLKPLGSKAIIISTVTKDQVASNIALMEHHHSTLLNSEETSDVKILIRRITKQIAWLEQYGEDYVTCSNQHKYNITILHTKCDAIPAINSQEFTQSFKSKGTTK